MLSLSFKYHPLHVKLPFKDSGQPDRMLKAQKTFHQPAAGQLNCQDTVNPSLFHNCAKSPQGLFPLQNHRQRISTCQSFTEALENQQPGQTSAPNSAFLLLFSPALKLTEK